MNYVILFLVFNDESAWTFLENVGGNSKVSVIICHNICMLLCKIWYKCFFCKYLKFETWPVNLLAPPLHCPGNWYHLVLCLSVPSAVLRLVWTFHFKCDYVYFQNCVIWRHWIHLRPFICASVSDFLTSFVGFIEMLDFQNFKV